MTFSWGKTLTVIFFFTISQLGCGGGDGRPSVAGSVSFQRQPIQKGTIEFLPISGTRGPSAGGAITAGQYDISKGGPLPGKYTVVIRAFRGTEKMIETEAYGKRVQVEKTEQFIPARFNARTELEVDIQPGKNTLDFNLKRED